jgi:hypothetical protein
MIAQLTYQDLIEVARICAQHADEARTEGAAVELIRLAEQYIQRATELGPLPGKAN